MATTFALWGAAGKRDGSALSRTASRIANASAAAIGSVRRGAGRSVTSRPRSCRSRRPRGRTSLRTLLAEMATLTRNLVVPAGAPDEAAFEITATLTPLQARAFALLGLSPAGT